MCADDESGRAACSSFCLSPFLLVITHTHTHTRTHIHTHTHTHTHAHTHPRSHHPAAVLVSAALSPHLSLSPPFLPFASLLSRSPLRRSGRAAVEQSPPASFARLAAAAIVASEGSAGQIQTCVLLGRLCCSSCSRWRKADSAVKIRSAGQRSCRQLPLFLAHCGA